MRKIYKNMEKGGMLLEAIAVLGLVAVSAPAIYKKNIARTEEIRDMTKASQLRVLKDAASQYIEKQYEGIIRSAVRADGKNDWQVSNDGNLIVKKDPLKVSDLASYLPAGYVPDENVRIYLTARPDNTNNNRPQGLVSAIVVDSEDVTENRGNRIARMIGTEGGYSLGGNLYGSRGVWSMSSNVIGESVPENRVVVSSTYSKNLSSADYIYRNKVEGYPEANMMYTDIDMNGSSIEYIGRLAMRYNNGDKWADPHISEGSDDKIPEGSTGGDNRDKGLSLLVHGERGEIVGKTRSQAKKNEYSWWGKGRDVNGEISVADDSPTLKDTSHFDEKTTLELSVGGPTRNAEEQDGYLRLRAAGENVACTRIESNYNMPERGKVSGLTGGGAFIACANTEDTLKYQKLTDDGKDENDNGGAMGLPTASLVADDTSGTDENGGSGYMIVTNPNNNRKAIMYGNYGTSFFNLNKDAYSGSAMELIAGDGEDEKVAAVVASGLKEKNSGATDEIMTGFGEKKGNNHGESSVANLYDVNNATASDDKLKVQFRADNSGGYLYLKDNDNASVPTVAVSGSDYDDADRTYSVVTRNGDNGYAKMQAGYNENGTSRAGAFVVRNNAAGDGVDVAVMTDEEKNNERSGVFILKDDGNDRFRAKATDGGAVYMGNSDNDEILSSETSQNRTIAIESKAYSRDAGKISVTSGNNEAAAVITSLNDAENGGGAMVLNNAQGKKTVELSSFSSGNNGSEKAGALILDSYKKVMDPLDVTPLSASAELLTSLDDSRNNDEVTDNKGGTLVMSDGSKRNIIVTARGPSSGGWMAVGKGNKRGVDVFSNYLGRGGAVMLTPNREANNDAIHSSVSTVEMLSNGINKNMQSPVMNVYNSSRSSRVSVFADMKNSDSGLNKTAKGGGLSVFDGKTEAVAMVADVNGGGQLMSGSSNIFAKDALGAARISIDDDSVVINSTDKEGTIDTVNVQASARIKAGGKATVGEPESTDGTVYSLVTSASQYNGFDGTDVSSMIINAMKGHMGGYATVETKIGHWMCIKHEKNCPIYKKDENGNVVYENGSPVIIGYGGAEDDAVWGVNKDIKSGRMHDYALYSYGDIEVNGISYSHTKDARHWMEYDIGEKLPDYYDQIGYVDKDDERVAGGEAGASQHNTVDKWHDNREFFDTGKWSKYSRLFDGQESTFPDQVPNIWNKDNENY